MAAVDLTQEMECDDPSFFVPVQNCIKNGGMCMAFWNTLSPGLRAEQLKLWRKPEPIAAKMAYTIYLIEKLEEEFESFDVPVDPDLFEPPAKLQRSKSEH
jgi:hypothetical protein